MFDWNKPIIPGNSEPGPLQGPIPLHVPIWPGLCCRPAHSTDAHGDTTVAASFHIPQATNIGSMAQLSRKPPVRPRHLVRHMVYVSKLFGSGW